MHRSQSVRKRNVGNSTAKTAASAKPARAAAVRAWLVHEGGVSAVMEVLAVSLTVLMLI
jgi:hypothetical protein